MLLSKHHPGKHNQKNHGRRTAVREAYISGFRTARGEGLSVADARQRGKDDAQRARASAGGAAAAPEPAPAKVEEAQAAPSAPAAAAPKALTAAQADRQLRETSNVKAADLSKAEEQALRAYQGPDYQAINGALRSGKKKDLAEVKDEVRGLDSVMARSRTTEAITTHRGMVAEPGSPAAALLESWQPGAMFREDGYTSTTVDKARSRTFSDSTSRTAKRVSVEVRVPAGTPAVYMNAVVPNRPKSFIDYEKERELLLHRGTTYRVVSRSERGRDVAIVVEVVPYGQ